MLRKLFASRLRRPVPRPSRKPMLETLEDRLTPTATPMPPSTPAAVPPPSFTQAAVSLYLDGVFFVINELTHNSQAVAGVQASIALYSPYAEPFGEFFLQAGERAVLEMLPGGSNPALLASLGLGF